MELIIADDCSNDGTSQIIENFLKAYKGTVKYIRQEKNLGPADNFICLINSAKGKYIAYLEGDDYWIDPCKLQKQIDFLEANKDFIMCFGKAEIIKERPTDMVYFAKIKKDVLTFKDIAFAHYIPTLTLVFRNILGGFPPWYRLVKSGDIALEILLAAKGKTKFLNETFGVYRVHNTGVTNSYEIKADPIGARYFLYKKIMSQLNFFQKIIIVIKILENRFYLAKLKIKYLLVYLKIIQRSTVSK